MSAENQTRLKDIALLLNKDINTLVQDADQIRDLIELIDQDIPPSLKSSLESAAHLDDYFASVKRASRNLASRSTLQAERNMKKQQAKDLHSQIQSARQSLATLEPELLSMEKEKIELEARLAQLNTKIQSHKAQIADLPSSIEASKSQITSVIKEDQQLKTRLSNIQGSEENDKKVLEDVDHIRSGVLEAIRSFLNE